MFLVRGVMVDMGQFAGIEAWLRRKSPIVRSSALASWGAASFDARGNHVRKLDEDVLVFAAAAAATKFFQGGCFEGIRAVGRWAMPIPIGNVAGHTGDGRIRLADGIGTIQDQAAMANLFSPGKNSGLCARTADRVPKGLQRTSMPRKQRIT